MASRRAIRSFQLISRQLPYPSTNLGIPLSSHSRCQSTSTSTSTASPSDRQTHFGYETVSESEKTERVAGVFHSVAESYDRMNDLMSFGWHRIWKYV
jgi:2-methoxy-6-polyprenyl-1,4-benzoquinol methylase